MGGPFAKNKDADGAKMKDYYSILEVAEGADAQEIKKHIESWQNCIIQILLKMMLQRFVGCTRFRKPMNA